MAVSLSGVRLQWCAVLGLYAVMACAAPGAPQKWQPTKAVTLIVPANTGGGADQMARFIQGLVTKHNLMSQPLVVVNKAGGAGAEGFLDVKASQGDPHKLVITLSNVFTTPLATGTPFSWRDFTPVSMLALDQFVLWVNAKAQFTTAGEYLEAVKAGNDRQFSMGGTGSRQEDQIITAALERVTGGKKFTYVPFSGGGAVAVQLVGGHVDSTVNNPIEAVAQWKAGNLRPLCMFDSKRSPYTATITESMAWSDIPTCKEAGVNVEYQMLRGIFMPPGVAQEHVDFYVDVLHKVVQTPDWGKFMEQGAFNPAVMTGATYRNWLEAADKQHFELMREAGFLAQAK
jgi:tripartite-type tricarboxylate transporter receptor subunit TctC